MTGLQLFCEQCYKLSLSGLFLSKLVEKHNTKINKLNCNVCLQYQNTKRNTHTAFVERLTKCNTCSVRKR